MQRKVLAGKPYDVQMSMLRPVQRKGGGEDPGAVHQAAEAGTRGSGASLPHLDKIQAAFGEHDVSNVQAYSGGAAKDANQAMGAAAYATGNKIAFGDAPDLHTAAHEAAHVVQQQSGVSLNGGVGQAGDSYENHADKVADAVVAGKSAEPILSQMTGGAPVQKRSVQRMDVQRTGSTSSGGGGGGPPPTDPSAPAADPDVDLATIKSELATGASAGGLGTFTPTEATGLATTLAASGTMKRSQLDTQKAGCHTRLVSEWAKAETANPRGFCGAYAGPDPIAVRKFGELDGEVDTNYEAGGAGPKAEFYKQLAQILAAGNVPRANVFGKCDAAVRAGNLRMLGRHISQAQLQPMLQRTAGVGGTFHRTTDKAGVANDAVADPASPLTPALRGLGGAGLLAAYPDVVKEYWISRGGAYAKTKLTGNLTPPNGGTWFSSGQVTLAPAPADTQFAQLMEIGALQPEWFADGACRFTINAAGLGAVAGNCVKPTCLDGMQSGLFVPNNSPNAFGVTGGGFNEFLAASVPASAVDSMTIISTSPGLQAAITAADNAAKASGHGSAMDQMERDSAAGRATPSAGAAQGVYNQVSNRTAHERTTPTPVDAMGQRT